MLCKNCGNNVKSDFKYCPYCGERFLGDFQDHYGELTPPYVIDEQPDENADVYVSESEEVEPDFVLPPPDPPIELEEPYFVYYPDAPIESEAPSAWSSVPESEQSIQSPEVLPNSISGWEVPSDLPPSREQQPSVAPGWEAPSSPPPVRAQQPGTAPGWEVSPSPPPAREQHPVTAPGWEAPPSPPPVREQQPGTVPGWEAPPSPPPGWEQQPGKMPTNPEPSKTTDRFTWQETPVIEQEKKTPPELKWEQSKESQWRGQDTLSRWEEGNHPRRPEPPPMEPKAPHIALKLLLIVGVLLLAGAVATGLYFGLIA